MPKRLTLEDFIKRSSEKHNGFYDYSEVSYKNNSTPVKIICPDHGEFFQRPIHHMNGSGCKQCYGHPALTTETFIERATKVHGNKYDYSLVEYSGYDNPVEIICPIHGKFKQTPHSHLSHGCRACAWNTNSFSDSLTTEDFIKKSREVYGDSYDYSETEYINNKTKVKIICPEHGAFYKIPSKHLGGNGKCPECNKALAIKNRTKPFKSFIEEANTIFNSFYTYKEKGYINNRTPIEIVCPKHGSFFQTPKDHLDKKGCPYCARKKPFKGEDDFETLYPDIASKWSQKNTFKPHDVFPGSSKQAIFNCEDCGEEFISTPQKMVRNSSCPICTFKKIIPGKNDLSILSPDLAKELTVFSNELNPFSQEKVSWTCTVCKGTWSASIYNRTKNNKGCPYCSGNQVLAGFNDLETAFPGITSIWDYDKNNFFPSEVTAGSNKKAFLLCNRGHSYERTVKQITQNPTCPFCSNQQLLRGFNDLQTKHPNLSKLFDKKKNKKLPSDVLGAGEKLYWWKCAEGHSFERSIYAQIHAVSDCPICSESGESNPEYEILFYLDKARLQTYHRKKIKTNFIEYEVDVFLPKLDICIEFDGFPWHKNNKKDFFKREQLEKEGYIVFNIRDERNLKMKGDKVIEINTSSPKQRSKAIKEIILSITGKSFDIDVNRDSESISSFRESYHKEVLDETQTETN